MFCVTFAHLPLQDFPWIVADEQEVHMQEPRLIPLKTMTSDIVKVRGKIPLSLKYRHHPWFNSVYINTVTHIILTDFVIMFHCIVMSILHFLLTDIWLFFVFNRCSSTWKREPTKRRSSLCRKK